MISEKIREDGIHTHLADIFDIQFRETAADIIQEHIVPTDDTEFCRLILVFVIVEEIRNPVECDGRFPASSDTLHDDIFGRDITDDLILLLLDRGDDVAKDRFLVLGKIFDKQFVVCRHVVIIKPKQFPVGNIVCAFAVQINLHVVRFRYMVKTMSQFILIVDAGSGRPPVDDDNIRLIFCNSVLPDIETFRTFISEVSIVDAAKVRFCQSRAIFSKGILGMFQNILTGS